MHTDRRKFLSVTGAAFGALATSACVSEGGMAAPAGLAPAGSSPIPAAPSTGDYGPLVSDPHALLDLPKGFSYRVLSNLGDPMDDGGTVPDCADGMGCFDLGNGKLALVRNHELSPGARSGGAEGLTYDTQYNERAEKHLPLPGGTTTIVLDAETLVVEKQFRSLSGTIRNCAGGETPWGSWLSCEENVDRPNDQTSKDHGYVFEVPADATGPVDPVPLKAMGRFNHEAACVDSTSGIVYLTEDRNDSLLYRFIPSYPGELARGGTLQAAVVDGVADARNWEEEAGLSVATGTQHSVRWITMDNPESPEDDLRTRGAARGATVFARGEGIWMGEGELYFTCTSGGVEKQGQIYRLRPAMHGVDAIELFFESTSLDQYSFGDNLTVAPDGHLIVCEDQYTRVVRNYLRGIASDGTAYAFALIRLQTEPAGACFSPDGKTLFVNAYSPTRTLAITGPWKWLG